MMDLRESGWGKRKCLVCGARLGDDLRHESPPGEWKRSNLERVDVAALDRASRSMIDLTARIPSPQGA